MSYQFKNKKHYCELLQSVSEYDDCWKLLKTKKCIGDCSYLYSVLRPNSYKDYYNKYVNYRIGDSVDVMHRGRSEHELNMLADTYRRSVYNKYNVLLSENACLDVIMCHTIIETYLGHAAEDNVYNELIKFKELDVKHVEGGELDSKYGVDIAVRKKGCAWRFIQVKPFNFVKLNYNGVQKDRAQLMRCQEELRKYLREEKGFGRLADSAVLEYVFYDKDMLWKYNWFKYLTLCEDSEMQFFELTDFMNRGTTESLLEWYGYTKNGLHFDENCNVKPTIVEWNEGMKTYELKNGNKVKYYQFRDFNPKSFLR